MDYTFPVPPVEDLPPETDRPTEMVSPTNVQRSASEIEAYFDSYSPATVRSYKQDMKTWWEFCQKNPEEIGEQDVLAYRRYLESKGYQGRTINRKLASLSKIFSIYRRLGLARTNPVKTVGEHTKLYKRVSPLAEIKATRHDVEAVIAMARPRTRVLVKTLANTGLRISELLSVTKNDIEGFDTTYIRIRIMGKGGKQRFVFVTYALYMEIKAIHSSDSLYLFATRSGRKVSRDNAYRQVRNAFKKITGKDNIGCHALRHYYATQKIVREKRDFKAVSKYLGHASVATTLDLYTESQLSADEAMLEDIPDPR